MAKMLRNYATEIHNLSRPASARDRFRTNLAEFAKRIDQAHDHDEAAIKDNPALADLTQHPGEGWEQIITSPPGADERTGIGGSSTSATSCRQGFVTKGFSG